MLLRAWGGGSGLSVRVVWMSVDFARAKCYDMMQQVMHSMLTYDVIDHSHNISIQSSMVPSWRIWRSSCFSSPFCDSGGFGGSLLAVLAVLVVPTHHPPLPQNKQNQYGF